MRLPKPSLAPLLWITLIIALLLPVAALLPHAHAQGENLLQNPGFDGGLTPISGGAVPTSWTLWGPSSSDKESLSALTHSAPYSWRLRQEYGVFTGGGYQTVAVQAGATYRFSIYAMIWTCNDEQFSCRSETSTFSDTSSGGRVRIGIDPTGGTNPYGANVQWSSFRSPFTWGTFEALSLDARATGSSMTVFTYYTADQVMRWHDVFWDDASLSMIAPPSGSGSGNNGGSQGSSGSSGPAPTAVPVQVNTQTQPDGSLIHIVRSGQSLWTIAQAYGISLDSLRQLNGLTNSDIIFTGQQLTIRPPTIAATALPAATLTPFVPTSAVTVVSQPTLVAQNPTATIQVVRVGASDDENDEDDNLLKTGAVTLAAVVVIVALLAITGVVVIIGLTVFRPPRG